MKIRFEFFAAIAVALVLVMPDASRAQEKHVNKKKSEAGRSLASVPQGNARSGQGQLMLGSLKSSSPAFLSGTNKVSKVHITGVCRDNFGFTHYQGEPGYVRCIDNQNVTAGSGSVNGYFGPAQRQAGVGILILQ